MADFDGICRLAADNADHADFVIVYIEEAHPADGWAYSCNYLISQHRTMEERLAAATKLTAFPLPGNMTVVAASMSDELTRAYGALPERLYVVHSGTVAYQGRRGPHGFRVGEVASWLSTYRDTLKM